MLFWSLWLTDPTVCQLELDCLTIALPYVHHEVVHSKRLFGRPLSSIKALGISQLSSWIPCDTLYSAMTHLHLSFSGVDEDPNEAPKLRDIVAIIRNAPKLQSLHLAHINSLSMPEVPLDQVALPSLKSVSFVSCKTEDIFCLFVILNFPGTTAMRVVDTEVDLEGTLPSLHLLGFLDNADELRTVTPRIH